jgi:flagellar motor switch protein FliM
VRELLLQMFMGEKFGRDAIWETHLATALWNTEIEIEAVLAHATMSLNDAMNLKVGTQIMLDCTPDPLVQVRCADVDLFNGRMGRKGPNIAIKVENGRFNSRRDL